MGSFETRDDCDRRVCVRCGWVVRTHTYRFYPEDSPFFERCVGLAWCSKCRLYTGNMVYVARDEVLVDVLLDLPVDRREQLRGSEKKIIEYLD